MKFQAIIQESFSLGIIDTLGANFSNPGLNDIQSLPITPQI